jgi:hypothetical protein
MRRALELIRVALLALAALALTPTAGAAPAATQLQANQQAARHDARRLLTLLRLPPTDITASRTEPSFASGSGDTAPPNGRYHAGDRFWEVASASPQAIIAFIRKHPPAGATQEVGTGSGSDATTGVTSLDVQFSWLDVSEKLMNRMLTVTVITPPHGYSVVVAQSQSAWFIPRAPSELLPSGVHAVAITLRLGPAAIGPVVKPGHVHVSTDVVWRAARVRALVGTFNGLPIVQPSTAPIACPMILTGPAASELTLAFKSSATGATLARAQVFVHPGQTWDDGAGPCNPIDFWLAGRPQAALTSPTFVKQIGQLIGANIS